MSDVYTVEKRTVARTGIASLGWALGRGFVREKLTVRSEVWCVVDKGRVLAECRGEDAAEGIASVLNREVTK